MDLHPDVSLDYLVWDHVEPVTHTQGRLGGSGPQTGIGIAKRRALTKKELAASAGAYTGHDLVWHLPQNECPQGFEARPGDYVTDAEGVNWTVLEAAWNKLKQCWRCVSRNLVLTYQLSYRIDIERGDIRQDAVGGVIRLWPPHGGKVAYASVLASVQPMTVEQVDARGMRSVQTSYQVTIERQIALDCEDRIKWTETNGDVRYLDIVRLTNPQRIDELPRLDCELRAGP